MRFYSTNPRNFFLVIFYHDQITAILVAENNVKYAQMVHHSPNDRWKWTICLISCSLPDRLVDLGRILPMWPDRTEMVINSQIKAQLLIIDIFYIFPTFYPINMTKPHEAQWLCVQRYWAKRRTLWWLWRYNRDPMFHH